MGEPATAESKNRRPRVEHEVPPVLAPRGLPLQGPGALLCGAQTAPSRVLRAVTGPYYPVVERLNQCQPHSRRWQLLSMSEMSKIAGPLLTRPKLARRVIGPPPRPGERVATKGGPAGGALPTWMGLTAPALSTGRAQGRGDGGRVRRRARPPLLKGRTWRGQPTCLPGCPTCRHRRKPSG